MIIILLLTICCRYSYSNIVDNLICRNEIKVFSIKNNIFNFFFTSTNYKIKGYIFTEFYFFKVDKKTNELSIYIFDSSAFTLIELRHELDDLKSINKIDDIKNKNYLYYSYNERINNIFLLDISTPQKIINIFLSNYNINQQTSIYLYKLFKIDDDLIYVVDVDNSEYSFEDIFNFVQLNIDIEKHKINVCVGTNYDEMHLVDIGLLR